MNEIKDAEFTKLLFNLTLNEHLTIVDNEIDYHDKCLKIFKEKKDKIKEIKAKQNE